MKICCVTGHRPQNFPWDYSDCECKTHTKYLETMACKIETLIRVENYTHFISGGAIGVDMDFSDIVLGIRDTYYPHISFELAVPCDNQDLKWNFDYKERYRKIKERADEITYVSHAYTFFCMQKRNQYMVDNSDLVLAFWNGEKSGGTWNTIQYTKQKGKSIDVILLSSFIDKSLYN